MKRFIWLGVASSMVLGFLAVQDSHAQGNSDNSNGQGPTITLKRNGREIGSTGLQSLGNGVFILPTPFAREIVIPGQAKNDRFEITSLTFEEDPFVVYSFNATDNGGADNFEFVFELPINPQVVNPANVLANIAYSLTASTNPGNENPIPATITPLQSRLQINELGFEGAFQNAGVDVGSGQTVNEGTEDFSDSVTVIETLATGPFDTMRITTAFSLSGQGAATGGAGNFFLEQIPEPSTSLLVGIGLIGLMGFTRSRANS